jgi:AcrR family transcriptional regulator
MARKRGLTVDDVVAAAAAVADRVGFDALTLADVATELGVRSPSLYSHVDGLTGLRRALSLDAVRRLGETITAAVAGRDGTDALRAIAHGYREFARGHPGSYAAILTTPAEVDDAPAYTAFAAVLPVIVEVLLQLGAAEAEAVPLIRSFRSALHGFVALEASGGFGLPDDIDASFEVLIDVLVAGLRARAIAPEEAAMGG